MPSIIQPLPTVAGVTGELARQLLRLVGPAYPAPNESLNAADALALGGALAATLATTEGSLDEAFPNTATYLLSEWEAMLGLPVSAGRLTTAERRAALLARWRTRFAGTPDAMVAALTPINGTPPPLRETVANESTENPPRVFAFTFKVGADPNDPAAIAPFVATVGVMKPAHTMAQFTNLRTDGFFCNDKLSLTNNTVL